MKTKPERLSNRKYYRPSGHTNWPVFLPNALLTFCGSVIGAWLLAFLFRHGFYFVLIIPILFGLAMGGLVMLAVKQGHCRSRFVGAVLGVVAGLLLHLGYYYFDLWHTIQVGPPAITILPNYIRFRLHTDRLRDTHSGSDKDDHNSPRSDGFYINCVIFLAEMGIVLGFVAGAGYRRASRPYCERCRRWMERSITRFDPLKSDALFEAIKAGSASSLASLTGTPEFSTVPNASLALDFCPSLKGTGSHECPAFVSIKRIDQNPKGAAFDAFDSAKGKLLVRFAQAHAEELASLASRFPFLATSTRAATQPPVIPPVTLPPGPVLAHHVETKTLPPEFSGRILSRRNVLIGNALSFSLLLVFFGGLGLALWGALAAFPDHPPPEGVSPTAKVFGITLLTMGLSFFVFGALLGVTNVNLFSNRRLRKVTRREFKRRPANLVEPDSPHARFVEVVPKLNWGKMMLETATDVGFLAIDHQRGLVLFEGDKECYRIPVQSIAWCAAEVYVHGEGTHGATRLYYVVVRANHPTQFWEAPFRVRMGNGLFTRRQQRRATEQLLKEINELKAAFEPKP